MGICCNVLDRRKSDSKSSLGGSTSSKSSNYNNTEVSNYDNFNSK